jgi:hypothetical protein
MTKWGTYRHFFNYSVDLFGIEGTIGANVNSGMSDNRFTPSKA